MMFEMAFGNLSWPHNQQLKTANYPECPLINEEEWPDLINQFRIGPSHRYKPPVHAQGSIGQCNADAFTTMLEYLRGVAGLPYIQLSAADLFDRIQSWDGGSYIGDAIRVGMLEGVGTAAVSGTIWKPTMTPSSEEDREKFRLKKVFYCPTFKHQMSAVLYGYGLLTSLSWWQKYNPDNNGWLKKVGGLAYGHAMFGYKPAMRKVNNKWEFGIWHMQSWGSTWRYKLENCCVFPQSELLTSQSFAGTMVTDE